MEKIFDFIGKVADIGGLISFILFIKKLMWPLFLFVIRKSLWKQWVKSFQGYSLKYDKHITLFFGVALLIGSYLTFFFGSLMALLHYYIGEASLSKAIFIELFILFKVWLFYWLAPPIPKMQIRLHNIVKFKK